MILGEILADMVEVGAMYFHIVRIGFRMTQTSGIAKRRSNALATLSIM